MPRQSAEKNPDVEVQLLANVFLNSKKHQRGEIVTLRLADANYFVRAGRAAKKNEKDEWPLEVVKKTAPWAKSATHKRREAQMAERRELMGLKPAVAASK